ncbi:MAG: hypothetical protein DRQ39_05305 [Gammaproteobacteria bacterium]|nr:MAG: hypothetical protein DRQ39_05305 [Gammaproteobacteria bacterium]
MNLLPIEKPLVVGQRVSTILYGHRFGIVTAIHGNQQPESISHFGGFIARGGAAEFDIVYSDSTQTKRLPEAIIRNVQHSIFDEVAPASEVKAAVKRADQYVDDQVAIANMKKQLFEQAKQALLINPEFDYLTPLSENHKATSPNLKKELTRKFKGVKFSVRLDGYSAINIHWNNGPTVAQVEAVANKYEEGSFNGMEDIYEYSTSPFNEIFGGVKYVFTHRSETKVAAC